MYQLSDIDAKIKRIVDMSKAQMGTTLKNILHTISQKKKTQEKSYPEYFSFYRAACEMRDHIRWHSEKSGFPADLYKKRAPSMSDEEFEYIENNFKQVSLPVYLDFLSTVSRIFNDTSWSVNFPNEKTSSDQEISFKKYCYEKVPEYGSIENFTKNFLPHIKLTDACGCLVMRPKEFLFVTEVPEEGGDPVERSSNSKSFEPMPIYFRCDQLVGFESEKYFIFESDKKSEVKVGSKTEMLGRIFEYYDKDQIVFITQVGKLQDYKFESKRMLKHDYGKIPCQFLKGVPKITSDGTMHISPFYYAVDLLDLVLLNEMNLQCAINSNVFPVKIIEGNECDFEYTDRDENVVSCDEGTIHPIIGDDFRCPKCNGSGLKSNMGPMGVMIVKKMAAGEEMKSSMRDPMMFVSPEVEPLNLLMRKIQSDENKARKVIHLSTSSSDVQPSGGDTTPALGMVLDLKALYAFLKNIADQIFDLMAFQYEFAALYLYGKDEMEKHIPSLSYPVSYDFKTESDYLFEISEATKAQLPPAVLHMFIYRYISAMFFNDAKTADIFMLLVATDRIMVFSRDTIEAMNSEGTVEDWEIILHDSGLSFIDQLMNENQDFFNDKKFPMDKRKEMLIERAKQIATNIETSRQNKIKANAKNTVDEIMNKMRQPV